jgi:hypothetical protein
MKVFKKSESYWCDLFYQITKKRVTIQIVTLYKHYPDAN